MTAPVAAERRRMHSVLNHKIHIAGNRQETVKIPSCWNKYPLLFYRPSGEENLDCSPGMMKEMCERLRNGA
ncbi:hypothetical protein ACTQ34_04635 [Agathobaculum sp. LCP25S3_E8]|uniref:hypothetical protein n=1 Tax=Agathobaculum sp. LCP25S3_E8 TaxID=3438735 RepID=UPI003F909BF8